jgi:transcriptional regulator with XRE-family HTH domain
MIVIVNPFRGDTEIKIEKKFGKRVRKLRDKVGYSQEELADIASIHRTYLGGIERGERNPSLKNIERIASSYIRAFSFLENTCILLSLITSLLPVVNIRPLCLLTCS